MLRYLIGLLCCLCCLNVWAAQCEHHREQVQNRDGSVLLSHSVLCPETNRQYTDILFMAQPGQKPKRLQRIDHSSSEGWFSVSFRDLEGDGFFEVEQRGSCGAGPNCEGSIDKLDRQRQRLYRYFNGGYADLRYQNGYLIESGRASCCSWEHHLYRSQGKKYPIESMDYQINVGMLWSESASASGDDRADCAITRLKPNGQRQLVTHPPAWMAKLCEVYGPDYTLKKHE